MRLESDEAIAQLLAQVKRIALVGASAKPDRPSHRVMQFLLDEGYEVLPINPGLAGQRLLGQPVYASLADLPTSVEMADIFRGAVTAQGHTGCRGCRNTRNVDTVRGRKQRG